MVSWLLFEVVVEIIYRIISAKEKGISHMASELYFFPDINADNQDPNSSQPAEFNAGFKRMENYCLSSNQFLEFSGNNGKKNELIDEDISYSEGFSKGKKAGRELEKEKLKDAISHFNSGVIELKKIQKQTVLDIEKKITKLSLAIAEKIIDQEAHMKGDIIKKILEKALQKVECSDHIKIKLNPQDFAIIENNSVQTSLRNEIEYILDPSISKGGCLIETTYGSIDARIGSQLELIDDAFESLRLNEEHLLEI